MQIVWVFYVCDIFVFWYLILVHILCALQIKTLYVGNDFVGDVPLTKKILAALTTGKQLSMVVDATGFTVYFCWCKARGKVPFKLYMHFFLGSNIEAYLISVVAYHIFGWKLDLLFFLYKMERSLMLFSLLSDSL